ncbi:putative gag-pol polyprotein, identical [Cucumis melo var. makuwa]|uniref:Gag-pol polyprotein, identical n=1 Tax=Cucumis melo var. makuwa TaxID=1194695 RepID=A0A5A7TZP7_CUCMM|nr:putative gag-pol polyprotein, identical [Cucumis melo var. makuwa]
MGSNGNGMGTTQPLIPIFKGEGYEFWSIPMKTLLRSQDLWDLVEQGYVDPDDKGKLRENKKKDSKALVIIQQAVHDSVFSRIVAATTRDFETLMMKNGESIADFLSRATIIISQMQTYGETIKDQTIVEKVLISLTPKFDHVVVAIEESKNLSTFTFIELMGSLEAHESRINRSMERNEEKAFQADYWYKNQRVNFAAENEASENNGKGENKLFMTNILSDQKTGEVWFIDSGCSNHMTGLKPVFKELNEGEKLKVELENGKELQVEGKGTVGIETHHGNRILTNVQYVPDIGYNLLSVGQLMESGLSILFDDESKSETFEKFKHFKAKVEKQSGMFIKSLRSDRGGEFLSNNFNHFCKEHGIHSEEYVSLVDGELTNDGEQTVVESSMETPTSTSPSSTSSTPQSYHSCNTPNFFELQRSSAAAPSIFNLPLGLTQPDVVVRPSSDRVCRRPAALRRVEAEPVVELLQAAKHHCRRTPEDPSLVVDLLSVDSIEGHNQVSGKGFLTTEPRVEAGNVVIHRGLYVRNYRHRCPNVLCIVVMLMGYVVNWNCMSMDLKVLRLGVSFEITRLIRASFVITRLIRASFGITRLIRASFGITRLICASFGITRLIGVRVQRGADRRGARRMREGHMDASGFLYASADVFLLLSIFTVRSSHVSYDEATSKEKWQQAMKEEMTAIEKNGTWKMVDLPEGKNANGLKWVYKTKFAADGSLEKQKARLVAIGYAHQHDIDFEETFSPAACFETSVFLNGELQEEVYVEKPEGFVKKDSEEKVYKLTKALYGLKQAPRAWYSKIDGYFQQNGFKRSANEPTLYEKKGGKNDFIIVCLYVDDIIYTSSSNSLVAEFKSHMKNKFEMTDLGLLHFFLGLEVCQTDGGIFISQKKYAKDLLKKFGMINCKPATTPKNVNKKLQQNDGVEMADAQRFRSLVGGLIYLTHTRPDISYSIGVISRFMQCPSRDHFGAAKQVMQYIAGTIEYGIWRSVSVNVFTLASGVITWSSKKQAIVALSSSEAEYAAATSAACQAIWLRRMLTELQHEQEGATVIFRDNKATTSMTKNPTFHSRTKHIDIFFHFICDLVAKEEVSLSYCSTHERGLIF